MEGVIYGLAHRGEIRYVGQTVRPSGRLRRHLNDARATASGARHVCDWIKASAYDIQFVILEKDPVGGLDEAEKSWIATLRRYGCRLTNLSEGGSGVVILGRTAWNKGKRDVSEETRSRMSASAVARSDRQPHTPESRQKIADSRRGTDWIREAGRLGGIAKAKKYSKGGDA